MKTIKPYQIPDLLRKKQGDRTQTEYAEELGISQQYLSELLGGSRMPGKALRRKIGIEKRVTFVVSEGASQ